MRAKPKIGAIVALTLLTGLAGPATLPAHANTNFDQWADSCHVQGLSYDQTGSNEKLSDGSPLKITPDARGRNTPILMIHGLTGNSIHEPNLADPVLGQFSQPVSLTSNQSYEKSMKELPSLIRLLQTYPGTSVYSFDYHDYSARWVTDPNIGQALVDSINCLYKESGEKVIIVAHSMGGLATREAMAIGGPSIASKVSQVIEFGTPNTGSEIASILDNAYQESPILYQYGAASWTDEQRAMLAQCGTETTKSVVEVETDKNSFCGSKPMFLASLRSEAGLALAQGSQQLAALPTMPDSVPVHSLAGDMQLSSPGGGFIQLVFTGSDTGESIGDEIVPLKSAQEGSTTQDVATCPYVFTVQDTSKPDLLQQIGAMPVSRNQFELSMNFAGKSPCFHGNLMQTLDLVLPAMRYVRNDIESRQKFDAQSLPSPAICGFESGQLVNGILPGIPQGKGHVYLVQAVQPKAGDLQGALDTAAAFGCDQGGVPWPETVAFYDGGSKILGQKTLSDITPGSERNDITAIIPSGKQVRVTWTVQRDGECAACGTGRASANFEWDGTSVQVKDLSIADELPQVGKVVDAINSQDQMKMLAVMPQPYFSKVSAVRLAGGSVSIDKCHPVADFVNGDSWVPSEKSADLKALRATPLNATWPHDAQRECLLTTTKGTHLVMGLHFNQQSAEWSVAYIG